MKTNVLLLILGLLTGSLTAQNIGINTDLPLTSLHVKSVSDYMLTLENAAILNTNVRTGLVFGASLIGGSTYKFTGAIKTIGTGATSARLGFYTGANSGPDGLIERLTIANNGYVGINTTTPDYPLEVNGYSQLSGHVGIGMAPSGSYSLAVTGSGRMYSDLTVDGILNPSTVLDIGNHTNVEGNLTVSNGKGIVRSTSATQMKMKRAGISFTVNNHGAGVTFTSGTMSFGEHFDAITVTVGQCTTGTGDWAKILIVPFEVDLNNNTCKFAVTNVSNSAISYTGSWSVVLFGN